jgi:glycosyltransferase involved in cell wall biosynthesis
VRIAIVSFLFNWPSTGGGIVHTVELCRFLREAGYEVHHVYARFDPWEIGQVKGDLPLQSQCLEFAEVDWRLSAILDRYRRAVDACAPDYVLLTDSWNIKPLLADAFRGHRILLRLQALECLCPLNNVRMLLDQDGSARQCPRHQLATPDDCHRCLRERGKQSGGLHRAERELCGVGSPGYQETLLRALREAEAVLVLNPLTEALVSPYTSRVRVVPWGMDPERFPAPRPKPPASRGGTHTLAVFQAGVVNEFMKGFHVLRAACDRLWRRRQDFELIATGEPAGSVDARTRYTGWISQEELPRLYEASDIVVVPTIAQEGLSRTSVEAMAAGRPVIASRIGGVPYTVADGATGLLCEPGNPDDLAEKLEQLLDDPELRQRMGDAGRRRFEQEFTWPVVIERYYKPLLRPVTPAADGPSVQTTRPAAPSVTAAAPPTTARIGCVLAVQDRPVEVLERTLQTYAYQTLKPADRVLLDFASEPGLAGAYDAVCGRYGWRLVHGTPAKRRWCLAAAYNQAVAALHDDVDVVFKSDVDVLLGPNVLETAARLGATGFCQFQYITGPKDIRYPEAFTRPEQIRELFVRCGKSRPSVGQGLFACPTDWFRQVGGFDLRYQTWGYEDHDLRWRAEQSLPVTDVGLRDVLLIHQWHPPAPEAGPADVNRAYFERMCAAGQVVRNDGRLVPAAADASAATAVTTPAPPPRIVVATRSTNEELYRLSGELLRFDEGDPTALVPRERWRFADIDAAAYYRELARIDADWVVNLDEDAFLLDPAALLGLLRRMAAEGFAACGVPDGGVVRTRRHNPVACDVGFTVLDLRRCRPAWRDWDAVRAARHRSAYEAAVPVFARRTEFAFDHFEPYYGVFFALLAAGERIRYLDAETWDDGVSSLVKAPDGRPLLLLGGYGRDFATNAATRDRLRAAFEYARAT